MTTQEEEDAARWQAAIKKKIVVVCEVCGERRTDTAENLHYEGWDTWPYFSAGYTTCGKCHMTDTSWWAAVKETKNG